VCQWVCGSVGLCVRGSVGLGRQCQSVHEHSSSEIRTGTSSTAWSHFLLSFVSNQFRTQCIVSANLNGSCSLCMGPIRYMGYRDYTRDCRLCMEPTDYVWYMCQNEGRLRHPTVKVYGRWEMCSDNYKHS
jgi:hypothetical protein